MRILIVMTGSGAGGLQQTAMPYAVALRREGHDALLALWAKSPMIADANAQDIPVALVNWPQRPFPFGLLQTRVLTGVVSTFTPDAVIAIAQKGLKQALGATHRRVPVLSRCGGTRPKVIRKLLGADHLIVTSAEMGEIAVTCGADKTALSVVPNFLLGASVGHDYTRDAGLVVGSLGRLTKRKGFDLLIAAAALSKSQGHQFRLVIGGAGEESARLAAQARELGVDLELPGWIRNDAKSTFLQGLDVFVCPSRFEPFGNVYLEAMQHGLPIVSADTTGARAIFSAQDQAIIVPTENAVALADGLSALLANRSRRAAMGQAGQQRFAQAFSLEAAAPRLSEVVTKAVERWNSR